MSRQIGSKELRDIVLETRDKSKASPMTNGELRNMIIEAMNNPDSLPSMLPEEPPPAHHSAEPDSDGSAHGEHGGKGRQLGSGGKSRMARQHLYKIAEYGVELWNMLEDEDEIPEWCQTKIAIVADTIGKVKHHLEYKIEKPNIKELELDND